MVVLQLLLPTTVNQRGLLKTCLELQRCSSRAALSLRRQPPKPPDPPDPPDHTISTTSSPSQLESPDTLDPVDLLIPNSTPQLKYHISTSRAVGSSLDISFWLILSMLPVHEGSSSTAAHRFSDVKGLVLAMTSTPQKSSTFSKLRSAIYVLQGTWSIMISLIKTDEKRRGFVSIVLWTRHGNVGGWSPCLNSTTALIWVTIKLVPFFDAATPLCCIKLWLGALTSYHQTCNSISKLLRLQPNKPKSLYLLSDAYSHTLNQGECNDSMLKFIPVITSWLRHGNVKVRASDLSNQYVSSPNSTVLNSFIKEKLDLEIHLVSWISIAVLRADRACFNVKSRQLRSFDSPWFEIHLVSPVKFVKVIAELVVERDSPAMCSAFYMELTLEFPTLEVLSDNSTLIGAINGNLQSKEIIGFVKDFRVISSGFASVSFSNFYRSGKGFSNLLLFVMDSYAS